MGTNAPALSAPSSKKFGFFQSFFKKSEDDVDSQDASLPLPFPFLSRVANSVISSCSRTLDKPTEELQHSFDTEHLNITKDSLVYARSLLEFCSYQALNTMTSRPDYLADIKFRRFTFDMMLAWERPTTENEQNTVDDNKTVGLEAFARVAPACTVIADVITVYNLFDVLTSSSGNKLHFPMYDKYLRSLEKVIKVAAIANTSSPESNLQLPDGEIIIEIDGTIPTQPIFEHIGTSAWAVRVMLTSNAMYIKSMKAGTNDKAVKFELAADMKQVIKPDLTGPMGARLYDKAVMYKSTSITEPVYIEFAELRGSSRRDYWLDINLEILNAHKFIRMYNLNKIQQSETLARAALGILRYHAVKDAFQNFPSNYKTLLSFNLAENLPGGYMILETLSSRLSLLDDSTPQPANRQLRHPLYHLTLCRHGIVSKNDVGMDIEEMHQAGDVCVGEINPLEMAVKQSKEDIGRAEAAQATVNQVKVEGLGTNVAIMKDLLFPLILSFNFLQYLASWEDPSFSTAFLVLATYVVIRGFTKYLLPSVLISVAIMMGCNRYANHGKPMEAFNVTAPPSSSAMEQLLALQEAISALEGLIQTGNIFLLKVRALILAALPEATDRTAIALVIGAVVLAIMPVKYLVLLAFYEAYTREIRSNGLGLRRLREWWNSIPAAPVHIIKPDDKKNK
nr:PREDICTED: uncharacterized protein LOC108201507 [Daucus carota subsp. sativus]